jgi:hypothetical protein
LGNWHPIKAAKFFSLHFTGVTNIKPAGTKKIKITFDSIANGNLCLNSNILIEQGLTACISSNLIYSFGLVRLDCIISEDDFREGIKSQTPIESFQRISIKKDRNIVPTRIVKLKFVPPKFPQYISLFNMLLEVKPSISSPIQCNNCLRFGYTKKFCRSDPRCIHCGGAKHRINEYPSVIATDPIFIFCKLPHVAFNCRQGRI